MQNVDFKGLFVEQDFLLNYSKYNLTKEEAFFLLQLNYISQQGTRQFNVKNFSAELSIPEEVFMNNIHKLYSKNIVSLSSNKYIVFNIGSQNKKYYTLKELCLLAEKIVNKLLTSKEMDIISSWIDKKFTKEEINEAFRISKNISYVNGILNNKPVEISKDLDEDDILNYDWLNK
ncbi:MULTISPECIES: DnaD domain protein [unclassified Gemella]|uniref:DnaD domain protein n=1 Tax=unclassified Gemella TaxID=2624949 RepID=UPI001C05BCC5|nr:MULTISPECIES: DnaD domain protein [unclassified Gemella]MBU0278472.1 DnaD domain protein [Gemella sp. zg-1178]QWQ39485.1 DnaD domain protein [Gemella sp. zg-570]